MKIGLYSPFLADNIGGGERYLLTVAECLLADNQANHQVDLIIPDNSKYSLKQLKHHFIKVFNLNLSKLNLVPGPFTPQHTSLDRKNFTKDYDIFYYMTDGSFFISKAKLNAVHFMIPFNQPPKLTQRFKLKSWPVKVANSNFTKQALRRIWKINIDYVHWGAVDQQDYPSLPKKNTILHVGRFFSSTGNKHCKRQDFLVKTFKKLCDQGLTSWQLILNGPVDKGKDNLAYFNQVKKLAKGYPIKFNTQASFKTLQKNYGQAKIYWHATGYQIDQHTNPQAVEHLGLSTVEAMAAKAVPVVINQGGQPEIITHNQSGLLWDTQQQLMDQTLSVINSNQLRLKLANQAQLRSKDFSKQKFCSLTKKIFKLK